MFKKLFVIPLLLFGQSTIQPTFASPIESQQMIVVVTPQWDSIEGHLQTFEKTRNGWTPVGPQLDAVVGKKGMGWGRGSFPASDVKNNTYRQEGDKRAPAGIFSLGTVFGFAQPKAAQKSLNLKMPYLHLNNSIRCVGAGESQYYNQIVDKTKITPDWKNPKSNEYMRLDATDPAGVYRWGLFVNHNSNLNPVGMKRNKVAGSCIFLHVWKGPGIGTSGCTAMTKPHLKRILTWLDPKKKPVLVQLPKAEYERLKLKWNLPSFK